MAKKNNLKWSAERKAAWSARMNDPKFQRKIQRARKRNRLAKARAFNAKALARAKAAREETNRARFVRGAERAAKAARAGRDSMRRRIVRQLLAWVQVMSDGELLTLYREIVRAAAMRKGAGA